MKIKAGNMSKLYFDKRGYFDISVFETLRVDCFILSFEALLLSYRN